MHFTPRILKSAYTFNEFLQSAKERLLQYDFMLYFGFGENFT